MITAEKLTVIELPDSLRNNPQRIQANLSRLRQWIRGSVRTRYWADRRESFIFYDTAGLFLWATPALPDEAELKRIFTMSGHTGLGVRYWAKGII